MRKILVGPRLDPPTTIGSLLRGMTSILRARASVALAFGASTFTSACSSGPISVGDNREPPVSPDASGGDAFDGALRPLGGFLDICLFMRAIVVEDTMAVDTEASQQVLASLQIACGVTFTIRHVSQADAGILAADGRPLWDPSELGMLAGGPQIHDAVRYLDMNATQIFVQESDPNAVWAERATNNVVISLPLAAFTPTHDVGIMQIVREPIGGTVSLNVYGHATPGTLAAAYYLTTVIAPNLKNDRRRYYVIEWTDQDGDEMPTAADLFELRGSG
jgi:hypothetical protein